MKTKSQLPTIDEIIKKAVETKECCNYCRLYEFARELRRRTEGVKVNTKFKKTMHEYHNIAQEWLVRGVNKEVEAESSRWDELKVKKCTT